MTKTRKREKFSCDEKLENSKFDFVKNSKWFLIAPIVIVLVGLVMFFTLGFNLGIDFTGGSNMTIFIDNSGEYASEVLDVDEDFAEIQNRIEEVLKEHGLKISSIQKTSISDVELGVSGGDAVYVEFQNDSALSTEQINAVNDEIHLELLKTFGFVAEDVTLEEVENFDNSALVINGGISTASEDSGILMNIMIALLVALVLVFLYVGLRFDFTTGFASILAIFHDILVMIAVMLICRIQINTSFFVALFVVLILSTNNTITMFDRLREDVKMARNANSKIDNRQIANVSVKKMLTTSIIVAITSILLVLLTTLVAVPGVRECLFEILVGAVAGIYSSLFITPALWAVAYKAKKKKKSTNTPNAKSEVVEVEG